MSIISHYITSSFWKTFLGLLVVLLLVLVSNELAQWLSDVASGDLSVDYVFKIILYSLPDLLGTILPIAFFLGVVTSLARFWSDSEMIILWASGYTWRRLVGVMFVNALIVSVIVGFISLWLLPRANHLREHTIAQGEANSVMNVTVPGRFQAIDGGRLVFYVEDKDENYLKDIFIAQMPEDAEEEQWKIIVARYAKIKYSAERSGLLLTLLDGSRYTGTPGLTDYTQIDFDEYRQLYQPQDATIVQHNRVILTGDLLQSGNLGQYIEFEMRLAKPLSVLILLFIAVAIAKIDPRKGRLVRLLPAVIIYVIYFNAISLVGRSVASGKLPAWFSTWWIHITFLVVGVLWLLVESGRIRTFFSRARQVDE